MHIHVDPTTTPPRLTLAEPDDFKAFSVVVRPARATDDAAMASIAALGELDGAGHVFVHRATIESLAGHRADQAEWARGLDAMVRYASEHGWLDGAGRIRAHITIEGGD